MTTSRTFKTTMTAGLALAMLAAGLSAADARGFGGGGFGGGDFSGGRGFGGLRGIAVGDHGGDRYRPTPIVRRVDDDRLGAVRAIQRYDCRHRGGHVHYCP